MNIAFYLAHPSQYYLFKQIIIKLKKNGADTFLFIKTKDILEELLKEEKTEYINIYSKNKGKGKINLIKSVIVKNIALYKYIKRFKITMLVTAASDASQSSYLAGIPSVIFNDDDITIMPMSSIFGWPFSSIILTPNSCYMGKWEKKSIHYNAYQKSAYLHPSIFSPDPMIMDKYGLRDKRYFLIRSVSLTAHHDNNIIGLNNELVERIINHLKPLGKVILTSERKVPKFLNTFQKTIKLTDIHHIIFYSDLLVADSQSMCHEAALLGTPSIRYNDFVGRIGVLSEIENKHNLSVGIKPHAPDELLKTIDKITCDKNYKKNIRDKAKSINDNTINLTDFAVWFIENYPQSRKIIQNNPTYQLKFK
jgi:uncharacterized protein